MVTNDKTKEEVWRLHQLTVQMLKTWQLERPHDGDIFHKALQIFDRMLEKAMKSESYLNDYHLWLTQKTSTIALRELCDIIGFDYWDDKLITTNAINTIDSTRLWWYGRQKRLLGEKAEKNGITIQSILG